MKSNIFITGFSGSGKTTVGREVARRLGWRFVDTDDVIAETAGTSIEEIFDRGGEAQFRRLESQCLARIATDTGQVVSTGGGLPMDESNRAVMGRTGLVVCLEATSETIHERLKRQYEQDGDADARPMLDAANSLERIRSLKAERQFNYTLAHHTVHTDGISPEDAAQEVVKAWHMLADQTSQETQQSAGDLAATVRTSSGDYPIWVGWDVIEELGERVQRLLKPPTVYVITDEGVYRQARRAQRSLEASGVPAHMFLIPPGEQNKNLDTVRRAYTWLAERKAERGHLVVAVGGGVVGDLAGFVAATYLRGMPFAQVPTSMLAMMDAAIGGKVAVDLPQGKNLVGAFYQPKFVLADVKTLQTLPPRELTSGWAEAIKHGLILDEDLLSTFESQREAVLALEQDIATKAIRRSVAIKADVVSRDERETLGIRLLLNYGHTIGHGIEAASGYGSVLHGEAVSIGMMGAAYIGQAMEMMSAQEVDRQRNVLEAFGLPTSLPGMDVAAVSEAMRSDKKTSSGTIRWVLLDGIGNAVSRNDVPPELVQDTLARLAS